MNIKILQLLDVHQAELRLLTSPYWNNTAAVRCDDDISEWMSIKQGVRQGCVASPHLFVLYTEIIIRELGGMEGYKISGTVVNNQRSTNYTVIVAEKSVENGLHLNSAKSFLMVFSKSTITPTCHIDDYIIFFYLTE